MMGKLSRQKYGVRNIFQESAGKDGGDERFFRDPVPKAVAQGLRVGAQPPHPAEDGTQKFIPAPFRLPAIRK
jgi:hypothetical protein